MEGKTALLITHDLVESIALSDRVLVMSRRPGTIIEEIRVELPDRDVPRGVPRQSTISPCIALRLACFPRLTFSWQFGAQQGRFGWRPVGKRL